MSGSGRASAERLAAHVRALEGERHPTGSPAALARAFDYVEAELGTLGLPVERQPFRFGGRDHRNVVGTIRGSDPAAPRLLIGAHVDTVRGTPGADDNASGVAGVLECARLLAAARPRATIELAAFDLEESQGWTYRVGSRRWAAAARRGGVRYRGALVLEMIGFRSDAAASQAIPWPIRWMGLRRVGDYLAAVGDGKSRGLLRAFVEAGGAAAPGLRVVTLVSPLRGWLVWATRRSDHASFWSNGFPALLLTDTANLRNPHYHRAGDTLATLDLRFAAGVVDATVACVRALAGAEPPLNVGAGGSVQTP